jgi:MFS family permease
MGRLSDRYGRVLMIAVGLALGGATTALMTYSRNYLVLVVLIGLFGLGLATVTASTAALVADLSQVYTRGSAFGVLSSIMDIGQSTGPMVSGLLISAYSYRAAFGIIGVGLVLVSLFFGLTMRRLSNHT